MVELAVAPFPANHLPAVCTQSFEDVANLHNDILSENEVAHQYTPTVVVAANPRNGRTPLIPSHGYFSYGGSRSPSSRSRKRGMKNSLVSVVNMARPVWP